MIFKAGSSSRVRQFLNMKAPVVTSVLLLLAYTQAKPAKLPSSFELCKLSLPASEYSKCLKSAIQSSFSTLKNGIPSLRVLPIDPLEITKISVSQGSGPVALSLSLENAVVTGFKDVKVISASNDLSRGGYNMYADVIVPEMEILANYKIGGRILVLPITGEGRSNFTLKNVKVNVKLENELIQKEGEQYIKVNKFTIVTKPGEFFLLLENLFGGDPVLGKEMNTFMNANWREVYNELRPAIDDTFGEVFASISNGIFLRVPYKTIFQLD